MNNAVPYRLSYTTLYQCIRQDNPNARTFFQHAIIQKCKFMKKQTFWEHAAWPPWKMWLRAAMGTPSCGFGARFSCLKNSRIQAMGRWGFQKVHGKCNSDWWTQQHFLWSCTIKFIQSYDIVSATSVNHRHLVPMKSFFKVAKGKKGSNLKVSLSRGASQFWKKALKHTQGQLRHRNSLCIRPWYFMVFHLQTVNPYISLMFICYFFNCLL